MAFFFSLFSHISDENEKLTDFINLVFMFEQGDLTENQPIIHDVFNSQKQMISSKLKKDLLFSRNSKELKAFKEQLLLKFYNYQTVALKKDLFLAQKFFLMQWMSIKKISRIS